MPEVLGVRGVETLVTEDVQLIDATLAGDRSAFGSLVQKYQDRLYNTLVHVIGSRDEAEDVVQDTFVQAYTKLASFEGKSSFYTWIYRIARNAVTSAGRKESARPRIRASLDAGADDDAAGPEPATSELPEDEALALERRRLVLDAIDQLPVDFREIVILRDIDDRSYEDIAALLSIPVGTVRSRLHRARLDLRVRLETLIRPLP